jgi:hypothetical protein
VTCEWPVLPGSSGWRRRPTYASTAPHRALRSPRADGRAPDDRGPRAETITPILASFQVAARLHGFSLASSRPGGPAGRPHASVSIPCPRGGARQGGLDGSGLELRSGPRMRWLAHGRSSGRRDDFRPRRFDEGEDPELRRPDQLATEWTCHGGPACRAPTNCAKHGASWVGTSPCLWVGERAALSVQGIPQASRDKEPLGPFSTFPIPNARDPIQRALRAPTP